jgi:hypothetical protein
MASTRDANIIQPNQNSTPSKVKLIIRNQFPGIELASPMYVSRGTTCYLSPDQKVDIGSTTHVGFNIDSNHGSTGTLMYKLQRKSEEVTSSEEATCIQFVITWEFDIYGDLFIALDLIEHDKNHVWNSDKLMRLEEHYKLVNTQHDFIEKTWFMHDNRVLMTSLNITCEEECCKLEMTISEGSINDTTQKPKYIGLNR